MDPYEDPDIYGFLTNYLYYHPGWLGTDLAGII